MLEAKWGGILSFHDLAGWSFMEFIPFHDWVVVEPEQVTQSEGGIFLPAGASDDEEFMSRCGVVVAVGPGRVTENGSEYLCHAKVGDRVEYLTPTAKRVKMRGREYAVVRDVYVVGRFLE